MNTEDFITLLAADAGPVDRHAFAKRFALAVLVGAVGATVMVASMLGIRPDLAQVSLTPIFWAKVALPFFLLIGALFAAVRLARPGAQARAGAWMIAAPVIAVWAGALYVLFTAVPDTRLAIVLGKTWRVCPFNITMLSVPGFIAVFWALKGLAPTRLALTGAAGG